METHKTLRTITLSSAIFLAAHLSIVTCLCLAQQTVPTKAVDSPSTTTYQSIDQSMQIVRQYWQGTTEHIMEVFEKQVNPAVLPEILKLIQDPKTKDRDRAQALAAYGLVTKSDSVEVYRNYFDKNRNRSLDTVDDVAAGLMYMSLRNYKSADTLLDEMLSANYWSSRSIGDANSGFANAYCKGNGAYALIPVVAQYKNKTGDPKKAEKIHAGLDSIPDRDVRWNIVARSEYSYNFRGIPEYAEAAAEYDRVVKPQNEAAEKKAEEQIRQVQEERAAAAKSPEAVKKAKMAAFIALKNKWSDVLMQSDNRIMLDPSPAEREKILKKVNGLLDATVKPWVDNPDDAQAREKAFPHVGSALLPLSANPTQTNDAGTGLREDASAQQALPDVLAASRAALAKKRDPANAAIWAYCMERPDAARSQKVKKSPLDEADLLLVYIPLLDTGDLKGPHLQFGPAKNPDGSFSTSFGTTPVVCVFYLRDTKTWYWEAPWDK